MARTPGPWTFNGRRWIRDAAGIGVLRVQIGAHPEDVHAAAAAPEMLLALRNLDAVLAIATEVDDVRVQAGIRRARAAIAAAEGKG